MQNLDDEKTEMMKTILNSTQMVKFIKNILKDNELEQGYE